MISEENKMTKDLNKKINIAVIGLGLIGGSMAKAIKNNTHHYIYGFDTDDTVIKKALLVDAINESPGCCSPPVRRSRSRWQSENLSP